MVRNDPAAGMLADAIAPVLARRSKSTRATPLSGPETEVHLHGAGPFRGKKKCFFGALHRGEFSYALLRDSAIQTLATVGVIVWIGIDATAIVGVFLGSALLRPEQIGGYASLGSTGAVVGLVVG
jgi:hypothetical protein